jgi:hypothetical protein
LGQCTVLQTILRFIPRTQMDAIRISKVEQVLFAKSGSTSRGTIHLTAHHIIFRYNDEDEKEVWVSDVVYSRLVGLKRER